MSRTRFFLLLGFSVSPTSVWAAKLRHQIQIYDSPSSLQTQGLCHAFSDRKEGVSCLPLGNDLPESGSISVGALVKANEDGLRIAERIQDKDIDQAFINTLFREESFNDASGYVIASATYRGFQLSLIPLYVSAAYKVNNPSLPDIHLYGLQKSQISLSYTMMQNIGYYDLLLAPKVYHSAMTLRYGDFTALDTATTSIKSLIKTKKKTGVDGDLAFGLLSRVSFLPSLVVKTYNILSTEECFLCEETFFETEDKILRHSSVSLSWSIDHSIGDSIFGVHIPELGLFEEAVPEEVAGTYSYRLSRLHAFLSYSEINSSFGFLLNAGLYQLGVQYTHETQAKAISRKTLKQTYIFASLDL